MLDSVREKALEEEISSLVLKGAVIPVQDHHSVKLVFVVPKNRGGWRPIIHVDAYTHASSELLKNLQMVKIDLKDTHHTIPVASDFHPLLAF